MAGFGDVIFFDGCDGTAVDRGRWPVLYESAPGETDWKGAFRWEADNVKVRNGRLTLGLDDRDGDGLWDVGGLSSTPEWWGPGAAFTYGKVEIRAKASQELVGAGPVFLLWPAANDHWPPEVNILETPRGDGLFVNHWQGPGGDGDDVFDAQRFALDYARWHTYTLEWLPDRLSLFVDGRHVHSFTENIPDEPMSVGLQGYVAAAREDWYGGSPNGSGVDRVNVLVDHVRVTEWIGG
jgi:beta-glucanase (GH16 family)